MDAALESWLGDVRGGRAAEFFAELGIDLPPTGQGEATVRCFANPEAHKHGDRHRSCSINLVTGLWLCHGCQARGNAYQAAVALGRTDALELARSYGLSAQAEKPKLPTETQLKAWTARLRQSDRLQDRLYELKGWSREAIRRLGLGWDGERVTFPVRVPKVKGGGIKLVGVVRYLPGGEPKSLAIPGSSRDLFPMPELIPQGQPLFIVEGEPDAVSMWSVGMRAVAIPGAGSWRGAEWAMRLAGRKLIVMSDCDQPGRDMAAKVKRMFPSARIVDLDPIRDDGYDVGDLILEASQDPDPAALLWLGRVFEGLAST